jgi:hypothetical protein
VREKFFLKRGDLTQIVRFAFLHSAFPDINIGRKA